MLSNLSLGSNLVCTFIHSLVFNIQLNTGNIDIVISRWLSVYNSPLLTRNYTVVITLHVLGFIMVMIVFFSVAQLLVYIYKVHQS